MSRFTAWSKKAATNPTIWVEPRPTTRVTVRLIPAMFGQHTVKIEPGAPHATTGVNRTSIRFPNPLDDSGAPTDACRAFIVGAVRAAIQRDGHQRWIEWPDGSSTGFTRDDLTPVSRPPLLRLVR